MDNNLIVSIIVGIVAIVPGIAALIDQMKKDNMGNIEKAHVIATIANEQIRDLGIRLANLDYDNKYTREMISKLPDADGLWKKMCEKPVVIRCKYCSNPNVITSLNCIRCGAPLEDIK